MCPFLQAFGPKRLKMIATLLITSVLIAQINSGHKNTPVM